MYSFVISIFQDQDSVLTDDGVCQIPDPLYKFIGSIICFYIPLLVMLVTYALTVNLLAKQRQNLGTPDWSSGWMGGPTSTPLGKLIALKAAQANSTLPVAIIALSRWQSTRNQLIKVLGRFMITSIFSAGDFSVPRASCGKIPRSHRVFR